MIITHTCAEGKYDRVEYVSSKWMVFIFQFKRKVEEVGCWLDCQCFCSVQWDQVESIRKGNDGEKKDDSKVRQVFEHLDYHQHEIACGWKQLQKVQHLHPHKEGWNRSQRLHHWERSIYQVAPNEGWWEQDLHERHDVPELIEVLHANTNRLYSFHVYLIAHTQEGKGNNGVIQTWVHVVVCVFIDPVSLKDVGHIEDVHYEIDQVWHKNLNVNSALEAIPQE